MIKIYNYPLENIEEVLRKSQLEFFDVQQIVRDLIGDIKKRGDVALFEYIEKYDKLNVDQNNIKVSKEEIDSAYEKVTVEQLNAIRNAAKNIYRYHLDHRPLDTIKDIDGKVTGYFIRPMSIAGIYVPGGTAPYPSSVLMCALPAKAAGVKRIVMCSPNVSPLTLVAARESGVTEIYKVGGAQAIAAMAYGTESIPRVDIIAGPGNIFVTMAKKEVFGDVKIDMIAGPSEILIIADEYANPEVVAADLLSQAEHDKLARSILLTNDKELAIGVKGELERQTELLPRKEIIKAALRQNGAIIVTETIEQAIEISNIIAPEHLELCIENHEEFLSKIINAGAVFGGYYTPEPLGDYYAGPSHVLPTSGTARFFEALNTDTFVKKISYINYNKVNLAQSADDIIALADAEGFYAHANAIKKRIGDKNNENC